jgi:3-deoxy-manno-octulosonate cytidylyltransferase (CMP-KDO synthetase)
MKNIIAVIPARLNSKRVKHKMLLPFNNKPLIKNVFDKVVDMGLKTFVVTDSDLISRHIPQGYCMMTDKAENGTHRISNTLQLFNSCDYILNIQGDMLDITYDTIKPIIEEINNNDHDCITAYTFGAKEDDVKVIHQNGKAMWFTRSNIGYGDRHLGVYAYKPKVLEQYETIKDKYNKENLEQNRILGHFNINVIETKYEGKEINTKADIDSWSM